MPAVAIRPDSISVLPEYSTYIKAPSLVTSVDLTSSEPNFPPSLIVSQSAASLVAKVAFIFSLVSFKDTTSDIKRVPFGSSPN